MVDGARARGPEAPRGEGDLSDARGSVRLLPELRHLRTRGEAPRAAEELMAPAAAPAGGAGASSGEHEKLAAERDMLREEGEALQTIAAWS